MSLNARYRRFVRLYGFASTPACQLLNGLNRLSPAQLATLDDMADLVRAGHRLPAHQINQGALLLAGALSRYHPRMLLLAGTEGFAVPQLQEIYLRETAGLPSRPPPATWMRSLPDSSAAHGVLHYLCGENYRALAASRLGLQRPILHINSVAGSPRLMSVPRPALVRSVLEVPGARRDLFDRLAVLFNTAGGRAAPQLLAIGEISRDLFGLVQGNVGEVLARNIFLSAMREGSGFRRALPSTTVLVAGAQIQRVGAAAQSFNDVLIGVIENGSWHWYGAGEVKSYGRRGYSDAAEQLVRASDASGLTEQFTLIFPRNRVSIIGMDGREIRFDADLRFPFSPNGGAANRVTRPTDHFTNLLVAPQGAPRFDLGPTREVVPGSVFSIRHSHTAAEIEYIAAVLLQEAAGATSVAEALAKLDAMSARGSTFMMP